MSFLIIDSDKEYSDKLSSELANVFESEIHIKENAQEGLALIQLLDNFNTIIAIKSKRDEDLSEKIIKFFERNASDIKSRPLLIFIGTTPKITSKLTTLVFPITTKIKELTKIIYDDRKRRKLINEKEKIEQIEYAPIPLGLFQYLGKAPIDIYIKMFKQGEPHMLKRFTRGDSFELADIIHMADKGLRSLYIVESEKIPFFQLIDKHLAGLAKKHPEEFKTSEDLENYAFHSLNRVGISESSLEVAKQATRIYSEKLDHNKRFKDALKEILGHKKLGFKQLNSKIISLFCYYITKGTDFEDESIMSHLIMASYLQDIKISDDYSSIRTSQELQALYLSDRENVLIENHASLAAKEIERFDSIPSDVVKIVMQHHGSINGKGFKDELPKELFMKSLIFILAEEFSLAILTTERGRLNLRDVFDHVTVKFKNHQKMAPLIDNLMDNLSKKSTDV